MATEDTVPLLVEEGNLRQRSQTGKKQTRWTPENDPDWDDSLPYGGKVYMARRKKPDPLYVRVIEAAVIIGTICFAYYAYFYFDHLHFHVTHGYAKLGFPAAQHQIGQKYLHGKGVEKHPHTAMEWFKKAADQGHPHASYNLAVGHLQGIRTDLVEQGQAHRLIAHAAKNGVKEAHKALNDVCARGGCDT